MDVVVVGGGIVGLASAYELATRGVDVTLCEKHALGAASTGRSAGGIRQQFSTRVNVELSKSSVDVWETFEERFGVDIGYRRNGYLFLAREASTAETFRENVRLQNELGVPSEYLDPGEAAEHCPELRTEPFRAATYLDTDGFADPNLAVQGYAIAAREAGVDVRTGTEITDIRLDSEGVAGVTTASGDLPADYVVNAAGAWSRQLGRLAGVELPVAPRRRQIAVVDPEIPVPEDIPLTIDLDTGAYFRPERDGTALVGGHFADADPDVDPDTYRTGFDLEWALQAAERAGDCAGYFGPETRIERGWAGLYAVTPDRHPVLEEVRPGFVVAAGFSGHGFQHAPATGRLVAELVTGEPTHIDISVLSADRFETGSGPTEQNVA